MEKYINNSIVYSRKDIADTIGCNKSRIHYICKTLNIQPIAKDNTIFLHTKEHKHLIERYNQLLQLKKKLNKT